MPIYCYECKNGHKFEQFSSIDNRQNATCPECGEAGSIVISKFSIRSATPIRWLTADGKEIGWKADSGISPPPGQPYPI